MHVALSQNERPIAECSTFRFPRRRSARGRARADDERAAKKKIGDASGENECPRETDAVALVSRKMVNVLIVDPHWASVIGIKLCINRERPGFGGSPRDRGPERGAGRPRGERRAGVEHPNFQTN